MKDANTTRAALVCFDTWAELEPDARASWLSELARREPGAHARLLKLIEADREASRRPFLTPPVSVGNLAGTHFGPWCVEKLIGTGGMAQVWLAKRTDGLYEGRAAIKLMRLASADVSANERFGREGRLLGRLSHPNIARLLDAGFTASGERYLVLEFIDGERLDAWCDQQRLTLEQRVALFIVVCKAVAHAHENLIVHRDLKPSNIFVTARGEVKLLDFGVARLLAGDADSTWAHADLTREAGAAMTPAYAAPEQLTGTNISTATDVYALGVVLYELLNGERPPRNPRTGEIAQPLWTLTSSRADAERTAEQRGTSLPALRKALRGDLAAIVAKSLETSPGHRYHSALELADDLQRVLDRRPIQARPDTALYRAGKFVQRHAIAVGLVGLVSASIFAGAAGTVINARAAAREGQRAVAVKRFLIDLFEEARGATRGGVQVREATLNDVLAAGARRVETSFASEPDIRDEVFQILVELYTDTGTREEILNLARRRVAAAQAGFGRDDPRTAPSEVMLAGALINFGEFDEARGLLGHAERLLDAARDFRSIERARLWRWQGLLADYTNQKISWPDHPLRRAAELLRARYPNDDELLATLASLPPAACKYGYADEAMAGANELYERTTARYGTDNVYTAMARMLRADVLVRTGHASEALPVYRDALEGIRVFVGPQSPNMVAVLNHIALANQAAGLTEEAEKAFAASEEAAARDHPDDSRIRELLKATRARLDRIRTGDPLRCGGS